MSESFFWAILSNIIPIIFVGIIIYSVFSNFRKKQKIKKLKSGEIPSRAIKGTVSEIKYHTWWNNNSSRIVSWYFIAKWINPTTNEVMEFESESFPYKDIFFKIRWMWQNKEDINKLLEHARKFVKEWDIVKIHISTENQKIYYIEDIDQKASEIIEKEGDMWDIGELINFSQNTLNNITKNSNILSNPWFDNMRKKVKIFGIVMVLLFVLLFVWVPALVMFIEDGDWINLSLPKFDWWINLNFGWSYLIRIIIVLLIAFIIYKVIMWYIGNRR